jgi:exonuclease VII small subunit
MADPNTPQDPFELFRRLWGPLGVPVPGMAMPTLDPQELEKRITELKSVELWLNMNLNVLRAAIQGLEMQKAGLQQMQGMQQGMQQAMQQAMQMGMPQPQNPANKPDKKP